MNKEKIVELLLEGCKCESRGSFYELRDYHKSYNIPTSKIEEMEDEGLVRIDVNPRSPVVIVL